MELLKIKQRLFFYNTLSVLAALVAMLVINWGSVHWISDQYHQQEIPAVNDASVQVQELLKGWTGEDWKELDRQLRELDYRLMVERQQEPVYSSFSQFQEELYQRVAGSASWPEDSTLNVQNEGGVMVGRRLGEYTLVAMPQHQVPEMFGRPRVRSEAMLISLLASGVVSIGIIILLSVYFSHRQIKRIMQPINALTDAAKRVEAGDLSTPLNYQGNDEFSTVCAAFDHMQRHLLSEREKNAAYEKARTDLVSGISHDLRTPLTSVKGYIKGLRDGVANTPEKQARYLDIAYRKACNMDQLLQRLFYFSKLETGNLPLFPVSADLGGLVRRFADETREELEASGGQVVLDISPTPHPVRLDEEQMYRVLTNLKENAQRYAPKPLTLTMTVYSQEDRECLRFADNGPGVPEEQLPHLFEQFWRGDQARGSQSGEGSGLGLYIVKYIVEAHGGTIQAENDSGLVFTIALPRQTEEQGEREHE
jgi:signal transduction histidine kinase